MWLFLLQAFGWTLYISQLLFYFVSPRWSLHIQLEQRPPGDAAGDSGQVWLYFAPHGFIGGISSVQKRESFLLHVLAVCFCLTILKGNCLLFNILFFKGQTWRTSLHEGKKANCNLKSRLSLEQSQCLKWKMNFVLALQFTTNCFSFMSANLNL